MQPPALLRGPSPSIISAPDTGSLEVSVAATQSPQALRDRARGWDPNGGQVPASSAVPRESHHALEKQPCSKEIPGRWEFSSGILVSKPGLLPSPDSNFQSLPVL